jgi:hypothetical protein
MARAQTWTRNIQKKPKPVVKPDLSRSIVNDRALEEIKRRAEDLGLIVHGRNQKQTNRKKGGNK